MQVKCDCHDGCEHLVPEERLESWIQEEPDITPNLIFELLHLKDYKNLRKARAYKVLSDSGCTERQIVRMMFNAGWGKLRSFHEKCHDLKFHN